MDDFIAYHGLQGRRPRGFAFGGPDTHPDGIHLGTLAQARMRAGRGSVLEIRVRASALRTSETARVRDRDGSWRDTVKTRSRKGQRLLTYLNRHEGLSTAQVEAICGIGLDRLERMGDRDFVRLVPEARDSWVVLDPSLVEIRRTVPRRHGR